MGEGSHMQYGHFDNQKREYVIDRMDLPVSWTNYLGVRDMCVVVNHTAGGYMFYKSPEYHRVTRFRGNAVPLCRPSLVTVAIFSFLWSYNDLFVQKIMIRDPKKYPISTLLE